MSINNAEFTALENAVNRALDEIDRLRSENAELRAALEGIVRAADSSLCACPDSYYIELLPSDFIKPRSILERTKK